MKMTRKIWDKLSCSDRNARVANAVGAVLEYGECNDFFCNARRHWHWPDGQVTESVPEYIDTLDEMHMLEKLIISTPKESVYSSYLAEHSLGGFGVGHPLWHTSASIRALAFVLTMEHFEKREKQVAKKASSAHIVRR